MSDSRPDLPPQLRALEDELAQAQARAHRLADRLPAEAWNRRPAPQRWSIGEQLIHLNLTSHAYLPLLQEALTKARESELAGNGPFRRGFVGWLLERLTEPPVRLRARTAALFVPEAVEPPTEVLAEFDRLQEALIAAVRHSAGTGNRPGGRGISLRREVPLQHLLRVPDPRRPPAASPLAG